MIIEIALGIVLGVIILRFLPQLLALGFLAFVVGAIILGSVVVLANEESRNFVLTVVVVCVPIVLWLVILVRVPRFIAARSVLSITDIEALFIAILPIFASTVILASLVVVWASNAHEPIYLSFLLPLIGLWFWVWTKITRLVRQRRHEALNSENKA